MSREPIAVLGIGCRFPGARGPRQLWRLLRRGGDAISEIPAGRFAADAPAASLRGGWLEGIDRFDAAFFGIPPRQAAALDPQQRLLLEVAWEALEDAGRVPAQLAGRDVGVFLGLCSEDYLRLASREPERFDLYRAVGGARGTAAGRLSHSFGWRGPSLVVDSDRSASLVAVHLACQSLWSGESSQALAGGANLILTPETGIAFSQAGLLAADGRCKPFSADADGFVRSEGVGVVVLRPLAAALAAGDPIYAVIRGSAVGHDGGSGSALMTPGRAGQEAVLSAACRSAGVAPGDLGYVEAHGTGTPVGDIVEAKALGALMAGVRPAEHPCLIGSVKSNLGHTEAAAGIAGLIKTALCLRHREIPPSLHCREPNPAVAWRRLGLAVVREHTSWPPGPGPARAGVSSFGIAGTNAHAILEEAPRGETPPADDGRPRLLPVSARDPRATDALALAYRRRLASPDAPPLRDVCATAGSRRAHHEHRLAVVAGTSAQAAERLAAMRAAEPPPGLGRGRWRETPPRVAFVFPGQGSQWLGMGREMLATEPAFRDALERCEPAVHAEAGWSLLAELAADEDRCRLAEVDVVQPLLFALQVALAAQWRAWGIQPEAVVGQSLGEVAAAHVTGALSLEDAARVICRRSRLVREAAGPGAMAVVELPAEQARELAAETAGRVSVAIHMGPETTVLSGDREALAGLLERLAARGVFQRRIEVAYASHSPHMDPLAGELQRRLEGLAPRPTALPMVSTVSAQEVDGETLGAAYWMANLRRPVRFAEAVERLARRGVSHFIEISPHPAVAAPLASCLHHGGFEGVVLPSSRRGEERSTMLESLGELYVAGCEVRWDALAADGGRCVRLPTYPWQGRRFWLGEATAEETAVAHPEEPATEPVALPAELPARRRQLEHLLRRRLGRVLRLAPAEVEPGQPLARLGLDSLMATELRHALAAELGLAVTLSELLEAPGVAALAGQLAERSAGGSPADAAPESSGEAEESPPSYGQRALWFVHRLDPASSAYHIVVALTVRSPFDAEAWHRALLRLAWRHPALRTAFAAAGGEPRRRVEPRPRLRCCLHDAAGWSPAELRVRLDALAHRPFDLARPPLWRCTLFRRAADDHVLLLVIHHIVSDFRSTEIAASELGALYREETGGAAARLPALPRRCAEAAPRQRERLAGGEGKRLWSFWSEHLAAPPAELPLATDRPRPAVQTYRGGSRAALLSPELSAAARQLAHSRGTTLYVALLAVFQTLLHRTSGADDLLIGSPTSGRPSPGFDAAVDYFANPVVLRADLAGDPSFAALLEQTRRRVLAALDHQHYPFPLLVERLRPERDPSRSPLFQVLFVLEQTRHREHATLPACVLGLEGLAVQLGDLETRTLRVPPRGAQFDLTLMVADLPAGLAATLFYNADLFDATTAERWSRHFRALLAAAAAAPGSPLSRLPLLAAAERLQLVHEQGSCPAPAVPETTLHRLVAARARRTPEAVAVAGGAQQLSYRELRRRARRVAAVLLAHGIAPEARVGIFLERRPDMVAAVLGVLEAGAAYVPLDPAAPAARAAEVAADAGLEILLTEEDLAGRLPVPTELRIDDLLRTAAGAGGRRAVARRGAAVDPGRLAYVLYTSGSTGRPKGVEVSHRSLTHFLHAVARQLCWRGNETLLSVTTLAFDISLLELFLPLVAGGRTVLASRTAAADAALLADALHTSGATVMQATPATWQLLADGPWHGDRRLAMLCGGEALPAALADRLRRCGGTLWNLYGPTEATVWATAHRVTAAASAPVVGLGRPLAGARAVVLGRRGELLPAGAAGELHLGGAGLARGYHLLPARTAERFVPDAWAQAPGERLYRTGDLVRRRADGGLEFLGRLDGQLKVRGYRVEPAEIEAALRRHPQVGAAAVVQRDGGGEPRLVAYVVRRPGADGTLAAWQREHVDQWRAVYEDLYHPGEPVRDPELDIGIWISAVTGEPIPEEEMREWVDSTVERLARLAPRRVLEIGCGTGLILLRLAPRCEEYLGTDVSPAVLASLERHRQARGDLPQVRLERRAADDFRGLASGSFDTVVLNSVAQYFPDAGYLRRVLRRAVRATAPGGRVFVGDVRHLGLAAALAASAELAAADGGLAIAELRRRAARRRDDELLIAPGFFAALSRELPRLTHLRIRPRAGRCHNELTRFRYDAVLHLDREPEALAAPWRDWRGEGLTLENLEHELRRGAPETLAIRGIPNPRLARETALLELLRRPGNLETAADLRRALAEVSAGGVEPDDLDDLARRTGRTAELRWAAGGPDFDLLLRRAGTDRQAAAWLAAPPREEPTAPPGPTTNDPLRARALRDLEPRLRDHLGERLPTYMIPRSFVLLDALPSTTSGKLDRRALPAPEAAAGGDEHAAPSSAMERSLAAIWTELLDVDRVGVGDHFFRLGGHSLLASQVSSRLRSLYGVELPVQRMFEKPTLGQLAAEIEAAAATAPAAAPAIERVPRRPPPPLSFSQRRLWFLDRLEPASPAYNMPSCFSLQGPLRPAVLGAALTEVARRHEVLRTSFPSLDGQPSQRIADAGGVPLPTVDLTRLSAESRAAETRRLGVSEALRPFDLAGGPLLRATLLHQGPEAHRLLLTLHHIVFDGWSQGVVYRELLALYEAGAGSRPSPLAELSIQYADFASWQRRTLGGPVLEAQLAHWRHRLAGLSLLRLPTDRPRPPLKTYRGAVRAQRVPRGVAGSLEELGLRHRASLYMTLLAAFLTLLHRTSGQTDIAVGGLVANRGREELEGLVGFFVNSLVMRGDLSGDPPFAQLLRRVRRVALDAYAHQDLPFEKLVEALAPRRDMSRNPLVQVVFALHHAPPEAVRRGDLSWTPVEVEHRTVRFDLALHLWQAGDRLHGQWIYNTDLFDATTIARLARGFGRLLAAVVSAPEQRLGGLELLADAERHQLLVEWSDTREAPAPGRLHDPVVARAVAVPDAVAVELGVSRLTYGELLGRSRRLAGRLRRQGIGPEAPVAVFLEPSPELAVALLAVLAAGGVYLPADPALPAARVRRMLRDAGAAAVVTRGDLAPRLGAAADTILVDGERPATAGASAETPAPADHQLAYLLYTSGSTGRPKGVAVSHRAAANRLRWGQQALPLTATDRVLQLASPSFDFSLWELLAPLAAGARLVLVPQQQRRDPRAVAELMATAGVTVAHCAPSFLEALLAAPDLARCDRLRLVMSGGEALPPATRERLFDRLPRVVLVDQYGPTEAAIDVSYHRCRRAEGPRAPIGRPIANLRLHVLDRRLRPLPAGAAGELHAAGLGLARGYPGRPGITAASFVPDPFSEAPGGRLYRTGDRARHRGDGTLELHGRIDRQIQIRGVRVEPGEVERALAEHPEVAIAAVVAEQRGALGTRLAAHVVPATGRRPTAARLRAFLRRGLPEPMMPAAWRLTNELPRGAAGKIDRGALPAVETPDGGAAASGPIEEILAAVWAEVLGRGTVGAEDDFFALGGHSLVATRVASRLERAFGIELPVREIFEAPTVAMLAARVEGRLAAREGAPTEAVQPVGRRAGPRDDAPLSHAQQRLWFLDRLEGAGGAYHIPAAFHLEGEFDVAALRRTLRAIARRHETLRTAFPSAQGQPVQRVAPALDPGPGLVDLSRLAAPAAGHELRRRLTQEAERPFDLARGPLFRALLLRLAQRRHVLFWNLHHIVSDGWSTGVLRRELVAHYEAFRDAGPEAGPALPELPVQYGDFAVWQRRQLRRERLAPSLVYWRRQLADLAELRLPTDRPRPAQQSFRGAAAALALPAAVAGELRRLGRGAGGSLFMTLLAGFWTLLHQVCGQRDLVVGSPIAGRGQPALEDLVGFFVNTLVLRGRLPRGTTFRDLSGEAREVALAAYAHQHLPFEKLVEALAPHRDLGRHPLFQVLLALQNAPRAPVELSGLSLRPLELPVHRVRFDLELHLWEADGALRGLLIYSTDLFDATTAARLARGYETVLAAVARRPEGLLESVPWLCRAQRHQVVVEWNDSGGGGAAGRRGVCGRFEAWAGRTPRAPAVIFGQRVWSYGELAARAARWAGGLRAAGVGAEARVAIAMGRSPEMAAAVLAVLAAGGVCVPLDPAYPRRRRQLVLEDSRARWVVVDGEAPSGVPEGTQVLGWQDLERGSRVAAEEIAPSQLAYVVYTSGSTGRPKGVAMSHRALENLVEWQLASRGFAGGARVLQLAPLAFDVFFQELLTTWGSGGALVLIPEELRRDAGALHGLLIEAGIERLFSPVVALQQLAEAAVRRRRFPNALRQVITAGEALRLTAPVRELFEHLPGCELHNHYGPSESHVVTAHTLDGPPDRWPVLPPIGRPIAAAAVHLVGTELQPLPPGVPGELLIGGAALARGYLDRPRWTAERFVPDPFAARPGQRLYRTGDSARRRGDGTIEFLGRLDAQLKVRGYRVEPGEVEAVLTGHPAVGAAAVATWERSAGAAAPGEEVPADRRLAAWIVPRGDGAVGSTPDLDRGALRGWLAERLPPYLVPDDLMRLEALPLTPSGKVDRARLPRPGVGGGGRPAFAAPRPGLERQLAEIFSELLGAERVGARDDFFALGGHSLLAVRLMARLETRFGTSLPLAMLFRRPTVEQLAAALARHRPVAEPASPLVTLHEGGAGAPFFCVHPGGGHVLCYADLARYLGAERPVIGLQSRGHDGEAAFDPDIESMAASYLAAIRAVVPAGPALLGGWSMGGLVAYEMARRQLAAGSAVAALVLIDTAVPRPARAWGRADILARFAADLGLPSPGEEALGAADALERILEQGRRASALAADVDLPRLRHLCRLFEHNVGAMRRYRPGSFAGTVTLLRPRARRADRGDPTLGWGELAAGVELVWVPGDHGSMVREPHVRELAAELSRCFSRAGAGDDLSDRMVPSHPSASEVD